MTLLKVLCLSITVANHVLKSSHTSDQLTILNRTELTVDANSLGHELAGEGGGDECHQHFLINLIFANSTEHQALPPFMLVISGDERCPPSKASSYFQHH